MLRKFFSALESKSRNYFGNVTIDRGLARVEQFYSVKAIKNNAPNVEKNLMAPTNFWEKGTGYGTGAMQSIWNAQETAAQLRSNEQFVSALFDVGSKCALCYCQPVQALNSAHLGAGGVHHPRSGASAVGRDCRAGFGVRRYSPCAHLLPVVPSEDSPVVPVQRLW